MKRFAFLLVFWCAAGCGPNGSATAEIESADSAESKDGAQSDDSAESEDIEVLLVGQQVGNSFCVRRTCWPIVDGHVTPGSTRVSGSLSSVGLTVNESSKPSYDDRIVDSNSTESRLLQWLRKQDIDQENWFTQGAGNDRARVWLELVDRDFLAAVEAEFSDQVDVDAATIILNSTADHYFALHQRIGTQPAVEPRLNCAGETRLFDRDQIKGVEPEGVGTTAGCRLVGHNHNSSNIALATAPEPETLSLTVLVQEVECASGRTPPLDDIKILVDETSEVVAVGAVIVRPPGLAHECPSNPIVEVEVSIESPVGGRVVVSYLDNEPLPVGLDGP